MIDPLTIETTHETLLTRMRKFRHDPLAWVRYSFPWSEEGELQTYAGPDTWQTETLQHITDQLKAGQITPTETVGIIIRIAIAAGNGPGKSALVSWIILWAMSTAPDTRGVVTANTDTQLRTKTWAELSKWYRLCIIKHWFVLTATAIYAKDKEHERTWRIDQVPWSEEKTEAFAGLHNKGKRIILIFDEASAIPDKIWEIAEGALTDKDTEIIWLVSGNPTRNKGRFRDCWGRFKHRWYKQQIDIRKSMLVNQAEVKQWIEDYGLESDWVRVHILGRFPKASDLQFISTELAEAARGRKVPPHTYYYAPKIIGVDPAWTGGDRIEIVLRQGLVSRTLQTFEKNDDDQIIAKAIAKWEDKELADAIFIDQAYGTGIWSFGKSMARTWTLVNFGSHSSKSEYLNKRMEMWAEMKTWLEQGGCIEDTQEIVDDLTAPEQRGKVNGKTYLESKEDMRRRGLPSPGKADGLCLTFAFPILRKKLEHQYPEAVTPEYNPFTNLNAKGEFVNAGQPEYDPLK